VGTTQVAHDASAADVDVVEPRADTDERRGALRRLGPFLVLIALVLPINLLHVERIRTISPLDELMHIDYLIRASKPGFLRMSDVFTQEAMDEIACRRHPTQALPPCGQRPYVPEQFSWKGHNLASSHSPYYYMITGVLARPLRALLPGDSLVTWGRVLGSVWLLAGFWVTLLAGRRLGVPEWTLAPFLALLALSPSTQHAATTINPDATCVLAGAIVLLAVVRAEERSCSVLWVPAAALAALLLDPGNVLIVLTMLLFALFVARSRRRLAAALIFLLLVAVVVSEAAGRILIHLLGTVDYTGNPQDTLFSVSGLAGPNYWSESALFAMVPPTKGYLFPQLSTPAHITAAAAATLTATVGMVAGALDRMASPRLRAVTSSGLVTLVIGGPLLVVVRFVLGGTYFPIPARYGLCLVPVVGLAGATVFRGRAGRAIVWAVVVALLATASYALA